MVSTLCDDITTPQQERQAEKELTAQTSTGRDNESSVLSLLLSLRLLVVVLCALRAFYRGNRF